MRCPNCGKENQEEAKFCMECATPLASLDSESAADLADSPLPSGFVGRRRELSGLSAILEQTLSGQGRLVMLVGEPGIGKTRMAQEMSTHAVERGARVFWGRCYEDQGMPPFWPWVQLIRSHVAEQNEDDLRQDLGEGAAVIAEIVSDVSRRLGDLVTPPPLDSPEQARFRLFDSISQFLKASAHRRPLVLILDDLHWADQPSLLLLQHITRELGPDRLLLVGTYRDVELSRQHPLAETLGELTRSRLFQRILLRGLSRTEVAQYVTAEIGTRLPDRLVEAVFTQTEGNPLFVTEVVHMLVQEDLLETFTEDGAEPVLIPTQGRPSGNLRIPEGVREVIGRRLNRLSPECNDILSVAAVLGREFTLLQLGSLFEEKSEDHILDVLEEALESRVVEELPGSAGQYQFSHALVQETLVTELNLTRRVRLHARIGLGLEKLYQQHLEDHSAELAYHFRAAETLTGGDKLVHYALLAGQRTLASYAYEDAETFFEMGLATRDVDLHDEEPAQDTEAAALLLGLGRAQAATYGRLRRPEAFRSLNRAFDFYESQGAVEDAISVAVLHLQPMAAIFSARNIPRALNLVSADSLAAGKLMSRYGFVLGSVGGDYPKSQDCFSQALSIARRENDVNLEINTLSLSARVEFYSCHWQSSLEQCQQASQLEAMANAPVDSQNQTTLSATYGVLGDLSGARRLADAIIASSEAERRLSGLVSGCWLVEWTSQSQGDWSIAREFSDRVLEFSPDDIRELGGRVLLEYQLGEFKQGEVYLDRFLRDIAAVESLLRTPGVGVTIPATLPMFSLAFAIADNLANASAVDRCARAVLDFPSTPLAQIFARSSLGILASLKGEADLAQEQYKHLGLVRGTFSPLALSGDRLLGMLAATFGDFESAAGHFEDAIEYCRRAGALPELAWACYNLAETLIQRNASGDRFRARELLGESLHLATDLGMHPLIQRVRQCLEQPHAAANPTLAFPAGLTHREVEVLRLIASGRSNSEIGEELTISVRTVANHVANILNKTDSANRAEAASFATRRGLA